MQNAFVTGTYVLKSYLKAATILSQTKAKDSSDFTKQEEHHLIMREARERKKRNRH